MRRTALIYVFPAAVLAANWLRLEQPHASGQQALWIMLLALCPALVRPLAARIGVGVVALVLVAHSAFGLSIFNPGHFFGPLLGHFRDGFLAFYDVKLPFDLSAHPRMHSVVLVAIFGFCLALALAVAARRAVVAVLVLVVAAGWPATLLTVEESPAARALDLVVVTARIAPELVDRLAQRALARRRTSLAYVDAPSFADGARERRPEPALLRLQAAGVPVAVVRRGDDLAAALGEPAAREAARA